MLIMRSDIRLLCAYDFKILSEWDWKWGFRDFSDLEVFNPDCGVARIGHSRRFWAILRGLQSRGSKNNNHLRILSGEYYECVGVDLVL